MLHRRPGGRELLPLPPRRLRPGADRRSRRGGRADPRRRRRARASTVEAILLTHTHFDHIGAVAPVAKATGAPVYCPEIEVPVLADIMTLRPLARLRPVRELRRRRDRRRRREARARRLRDRRHLHPRPQPRATSPTRSPTSRRCSPATSSSRARSAASTCPAATGRPCSRASARWSRASRRGDDRLPGPHGDHDARRRAGDEPVPRRARPLRRGAR